MKNLKDDSFLSALYSLYNAQVDRDAEETRSRVKNAIKMISQSVTIGTNELVTAYMVRKFFSEYFGDGEKNRLGRWLDDEANDERYKDYKFFKTVVNFADNSFNEYFHMVRTGFDNGVGFEYWKPAMFGEEFLDKALVVSCQLLEIEMNELMKRRKPGLPHIKYRFFQTANGEPGVYMSESLKYSPFLIYQGKAKISGYWFFLKLRVWKGWNRAEKILRNLSIDMFD